MTSKTVRLIANPVSGRRPGSAALAAAAQWLAAHGWTVERCATQYVGHARVLAAGAAAAGCNVVLACGGDGTINEVVNGIAGTQTALALIPAGTVNIWARETGIPFAAEAAAALLEHGARQRVDLGRAHNRFFLMLLSAGTDSSAVAAVAPAAKRRWGRAAFISTGLVDLFRHGGRHMNVIADGERFSGPTLVAITGNSRSYGGVLQATYQAHVDDGLLDLCLYGGRSWSALPRHVVLTRLLRHDRMGNVVYRKARRILIESEQPMPWQADGEPAGMTPVAVEVVPDALTVIVPAGGKSSIFSKPPL